MGVLDHVCRLVADIISTYSHKNDNFLSNESKLYFICLWVMISIGIVIILFFQDSSPKKLLSIAGSLSGIVMFLYSTLILILNLKLEKQISKENEFNPFRIGIWRKIVICLGILLYGFFSFSLILNLFN